MFRPVNPPVQPTPQGALSATLATKCEYVMTVPSFVEVFQFIEDEEFHSNIYFVQDLVAVSGIHFFLEIVAECADRE